jgi:hypothetical protein
MIPKTFYPMAASGIKAAVPVSGVAPLTVGL